MMISKNLNYLRKKNKISQQALADAMEIPRTTLGDYERGKTEPNLAMLIKLSDYFEVKVDDLIRADLSHQDLEILRNKDLRVLAISVDQDNNGNIELVDTKAEAGYLESFNDPEYIRDLPKIAFPSIPEGTYRGFEIRGESMLPVEPGSVVICSYVERLSDVKDGRTYIIVSKDDGLVYKRVRNLKDKNSFFLQSDNESYLPYEVPYEEVAEIWQYYAHLSFSDSKATFNYMLEEKLNDIQKKVGEMHSKLL
ncbi:MAG: helix-turn-helix domain-containing protein [Saprospiraceae bacterium]|nr:helix-turn-helix domain-containing protein [Saprospiraceae bacterium]